MSLPAQHRKETLKQAVGIQEDTIEHSLGERAEKSSDEKQASLPPDAGSSAEKEKERESGKCKKMNPTFENDPVLNGNDMRLFWVKIYVF